MQDVWKALFDGGVDVALTGHDHNYERFKPLNDAGAIDEATGIVQFVVGTGGKLLRPFEGDAPETSATRNADTWGVLQLKLHEDRAEFHDLAP